MRVPLRELLEARRMTVYQLAHAVEQHGVSQQAVYRLARVDGRPKRFDVRLLSALWEVLELDSFNQLLHLDGTKPEPPPPTKNFPAPPSGQPAVGKGKPRGRKRAA